MLEDLKAQMAWEEECVERGSATYYANQDRLRDNGQGDSTDAMSHIIRERLEDTGDFLRNLMLHKNIGVNVKYHKYIKAIAGPNEDYMKVAYIGLKHVISSLLKQKSRQTTLRVCLGIGARLETEVKCTLFESKHPEYFDTVRKSFAQQNVSDFTHKRKVISKKFNEFDIEWEHWDKRTLTQVGSRVLHAVLNTFGDIFFVYTSYERGKTISKIDTTDEFNEWSAEFEKESGLLNPSYLPLMVPPVAWGDQHTGAYYTPRMQMKLIKTKGKEHKAFVADVIPHHHLKAINKLQRTAWVINHDVLAVQEQIYNLGLSIGIPSSTRIQPPEFPQHLQKVDKEDMTPDQVDEFKAWKSIAKVCYGKEQQRKGQVLAFMQSHKLAKELREWPRLYFAYTCDFRGRVYCATSGLSPQGADTAKGLLTFEKGVELGEDGIKWLAVNGANKFGEDKGSYQQRVDWVHANRYNIQRVVDDPIGAREYWGAADKPYQFLAFCFEWAKCDFGKNPRAMSRLPVGLDGSCNGLQHFSAMLRDEVGAKATNLKQGELPEDIYQEVANVVMKKLRASTASEAKVWLKVGVPRKCVKRPVMTLPYGATQQSARTYIMEYVVSNWRLFEMDEREQWTMAKFLTPLVWEAIGEVVIAARGAMAWLQKNVGKDYMKWYTPLGFPVYQFYKNVESTRVSTQIDGGLRLRLRDFDNEGSPAKTGQRNGISPNFVHSIDSTHMIMTINATDFGSYAMVHDDYGTHAGNVEMMFKTIRRTFKKLYTDFDPLTDWAEQVGADASTLPQRGTYNIEDILKASYFFG